MKKTIGQEKNEGSLEGSNSLASLKEKDLEHILNVRFEEGVYFEAVVDMEEWI